ncbi:unnamed protein product [Protopolystoma xenopodis]|uniref:Uncharacterized protein n=1 Tax=Protopolystoma xenopodis TaxID=117903 RepID=A0A3S5BPJ4_9PLAT|nr:unnamed protein product [Protopolystoma xenopodis]
MLSFCEQNSSLDGALCQRSQEALDRMSMLERANNALQKTKRRTKKAVPKRPSDAKELGQIAVLEQDIEVRKKNAILWKEEHLFIIAKIKNNRLLSNI